MFTTHILKITSYLPVSVDIRQEISLINNLIEFIGCSIEHNSHPPYRSLGCKKTSLQKWMFEPCKLQRKKFDFLNVIYKVIRVWRNNGWNYLQRFFWPSVVLKKTLFETDFLPIVPSI